LSLSGHTSPAVFTFLPISPAYAGTSHLRRSSIKAKGIVRLKCTGRRRPEFIAEAIQNWINAVGAKTTYILPGSPWENGYCESFNAHFKDDQLNGEMFHTLN